MSKNKFEKIRTTEQKEKKQLVFNDEQEKKLYEEIIEKKKQFRKLKNRGTWKYFYTEVRAKTIELQKNENLNDKEKVSELKKFFSNL